MKVFDAETGRLLITRVRVAESPQSRIKGLIGKKTLADDEGLFIPRCRMIHTFFMSMAIDVVFLNEEGLVLDMVEALKPWRTAFCRQVGGHDTLELASGAGARLGIGTGSRLKTDFA